MKISSESFYWPQVSHLTETLCIDSARPAIMLVRCYVLIVSRYSIFFFIFAFIFVTKFFIELKKIVPQHTYGRAGGSGGKSSYSFTTSALDRVSGQRHAPAALYPRGKDRRYPLDRRLGGPQSRSGHTGYRKNPLVSTGDRNSIAQSSSL
jgi:hypothetical protein